MGHVNNILRVFHQATADEIHHGLSWYMTAREDAASLHSDVSIAAGVIAALSPGMKYDFNLLAAEALLAGESLGGFGVRWYANVLKARLIIAGEPVLDVLQGLKVRAFYQCIMHPDDAETVCVDSHAYGVWSGKRITGEQMPHLDRRNRYGKVANDYRLAAKQVGMLPMQLQAVCWVSWRNKHGIKSVAPF